MLVLDGARVVVVGLGDTGLSLARWLKRQGAAVSATDTRKSPPQAAVLQRECPGVPVTLGVGPDAAIAGADGEVSGLKIDLTKLFGGDEGESAIEMAVKERDRELILDGRDAVGMSVGIRQRHREQMDQLLADLDALQF